MKDGFLKVGAASPFVHPADPDANGKELAAIAKKADKAGVKILVFPELSLTGAIIGDLFFSESLQKGAAEALFTFLKATEKTKLISVVGLPLALGSRLFDCAAVCQSGKLLGLVPAENAPKQFTQNRCEMTSVNVMGESIPFGKSILFSCTDMPDLTFAVEVGKDTDSPCPPSIAHALAGATLVCHPAATEESVGKREFDVSCLLALSHRTICAFVEASAGMGESTTDAVFAGNRTICERGALLAKSEPFSENVLTVSEVDLSMLQGERRRRPFVKPADLPPYQTVFFSLPVSKTELTRHVPASPFIPDNAEECDRRCEEILNIQANGLRTRAVRAYAEKLVVGISGGLDSTLALLVMARANDLLGRDRKNIIALTMPGFGTTARTKDNATVLCEELGVDFRCIPLQEAVNQHFKDIGHDPSDRNVTYENSQARERTQILMDLANDCNGLVVGTGDLSELALGWATYNGDHMSMYAVNASVTKTMIRKIVDWYARKEKATGNTRLSNALFDILNTPVSPELLPADGDGKIAQKTEDLVGPYEIHDFYLFYLLRYGFAPAKMFRLAQYALGDRFDDETLKKWLNVFLRRFFTQQFKRSCMPDGPKVGSVDLSPRGSWAMPSDASAALWLGEADEL